MDIDLELLRSERPRSLEVDLGALADNYSHLKKQLGHETRIIPVLKANAYGHGVAQVARTLARLDPYSLSTGSLDDALAIREAGVNKPILLFGGSLPGAVPLMLEHDLTATVYDVETAKAVSRASNQTSRVFVKVDGGHGRLGVPIEEAVEFVARVAELDHVVVEGVYTHLAFFDSQGRAWVRDRLRTFDQFLDALETAGIEVPITQALSSSGLVAGLESRANAVSPGSLLYGISSVAPELVDMSGYRPVLTAIKTRLIHVGPRAASPWVGVVPLGLADGYPDMMPGQAAYGLIDGQRAAIRGVSLEHISLDLTGLQNARIGDEVVLLGRCAENEITLYDLARWSGKPPTHLLVGLSRRMPYRYLCEGLPRRLSPEDVREDTRM